MTNLADPLDHFLSAKADFAAVLQETERLLRALDETERLVRAQPPALKLDAIREMAAGFREMTEAQQEMNGLLREAASLAASGDAA